MLLDRVLLPLRFLRFGVSMLRCGPKARRSVADLIEEQAAARPEQCFVRFEGREVSYREYDRAANRIAHWALSLGIGPGEAVGLLMENRPEFLETWGGLAKAGATIALLNTNLTGKALAHVIEAGNIRRLVVGSECAQTLASLPEDARRSLTICVAQDPASARSPLDRGVESLDDALLLQSSDPPPRRVRESVRAGDELFYIYTSGTTGLPKAARFSHSRFFGACIHSYLQGFGPGDTMYCTLPLYHTVGGVLAISAVLTGGGTLALRRRFSATRFWNDVVEMRATAFIYIGELCRYLVQQPPGELDGKHELRYVVGNGLRPDVWEEFRDRFAIPHIVEFYGATEANVTLMNLDDRPGSVGKLPPGMSSGARLIRYDVERDTHPRGAEGHCIVCKPGETGELIGRITTGSTALGRYEGYTSREASEKKILRDVFEKGDAWFRSGDLLRADEQGYFYFVDRIGDTFRWKGENVSTQEVSEAISGYPGIEISTVYGVEVPGASGRAGMAAITLGNGGALDGTRFYDHVRSALPPYATPAFVRLCSDLEVTGTFKLRKVDLQRESFDPKLVHDPLYVRDDRREAYVPLTPETHAEILSGAFRL